MKQVVTTNEVELIAHSLAREIMRWNEPIPDFGTRFVGRLEGCLAAPFQRFGGRYLYRGLLRRAPVLFYLMIKDHPFQNGNKRIAMTTLFYYLHKNGKWLVVDNKELYNFAVWVAESNARLKDETVAAIEKFLQTYLVPNVD